MVAASNLNYICKVSQFEITHLLNLSKVDGLNSPNQRYECLRAFPGLDLRIIVLKLNLIQLKSLYPNLQ